MHTAYLTHPVCLEHVTGGYHPESPRRLQAIQDRLVEDRLWELLQHREATAAQAGDLLRVHAPGHVDRILAAAPREGQGAVLLDPDTVLGPGSLAAALAAAGAVMGGVDLVLSREVENAFCAVRPPGHHAERDQAMGFCLFNNLAVGVAHALERHGLERVAVVDFDVHHGNGTEDIFADDPRVLLCSTFQHPFYPYKGADTVSDHIVNVPLPAYSDGNFYREQFVARVEPAVEAFRPELIMVSAGFDAHRDDDLAMVGLVDDDFRWIGQRLCAMARRLCGGRLVSVLEGGYNLEALGRCVSLQIRTMLDVG